MFQLECPGMKVEAFRVVATCNARTPTKLIAYFDESYT